MDLKDSPEEAAFRAEVRAWLEANAELKPEDRAGLPSYADGPDYVERAKACQRKLYEAGWAGLTWPKEYGGRGGTAMHSIIWGQESGRYDLPVGLFTVAVGFAGPTLIHHGSDEQKERYLRPILRGDEVWCQLFSEPGAGSDLAGLTTRAVREGDEFIVNGQKVWTSGAQHADFGILLARTDPDAPKHGGITYFICDMRAEGIEIRPLRQTTGEAHFNEVFFTDVRIPAANVVGEVNDGWRAAMTTFLYERSVIGSGTGGGPEFPALLRMAQARGRTTDPSVRQALAEVFVRSEIMRYLGYRVQTAISQGRAAGPEASIMKLAIGQLLTRTGAAGLAAAGPDGLLASGDAPDAGRWQYRFLSAPSIRIAGGTDDIQRNIIGERVLGLPREPRVDKDVPFRELQARIR